jgi:hypothetical protein
LIPSLVYFFGAGQLQQCQILSLNRVILGLAVPSARAAQHVQDGAVLAGFTVVHGSSAWPGQC